MVQKWLGDRFNPKERALQKQLERGDRQASLQMLVDLYDQGSTSQQLKRRCVHELVNLKALTDPYLDVYIDYLQRAQRDEVVTEIHTLLAGICNVDFDSDQERLLFAHQIAMHLRQHNLQNISGVACTQGIYALLVQHDFAQAATFFLEALKINASSHVVQVGLLTSLIRQQRYDAALRHLQQFGQPLHPQVEELALFLRTWHWLEDADSPGPLPVSAQQLADLDPGHYIGLQADLVIGRLHLLEGHAQQALNVLRAAAAELSDEPRWHYYMAWACTLVGDRQGVANSLQSASNWSGNWTIACLLLDIDPEMAQQYGVLDGRVGSPSVSSPYAAIFHFRTAQTGSALPQQLLLSVGSGSFEEDLEALRSQLGAAFMASDERHMYQLVDMPLFIRLPLADQWFWRGLYAFLIGNQEQGSTLLEKAAKYYGHPRAARVLALHLSQQKRIELEKERQQAWNEILPRLFSATPALIAVACEDLLALLTAGSRPNASTCMALALLIAQACKRAAKLEQVEKMLALLKYLAADQDLKPVQQCLTLVARLYYQKADAEQRLHIFQQIKVLALANPSNFALRLLAASLSLKHQDRPSAVALLAEASFADTLEQQLQASLCNALTRTPTASESLTLPPQTPEPIRQSSYMLQAAHAFATQQPVQGYVAFIAAAQGELNTLLPVTNLRSLILSLFSYSRKQKEKAQPLLEKMLIVATRLGDSEFSLSVARTLTSNDELTTVGQHLAETLTPAIDPEGRLRREWGQLHCYQAIVAYKAQDYLKAAQHLRLAVTFENRPTEAEKFKRFADRLEGEACVRRLLVLQEGKVAQPLSYSPGRYRFLAHAIVQYPPLHQALLQESDAEVERIWAVLLKNAPQEISFQHGQAVIYRELALTSPTDQEPSDSLLLLSTLLWGLLLCTDEFWSHFTQIHSTQQNASGQTLSAQRESEVMQQAIEDLLCYHSIIGRRHLKEGQIRRALVHLRCLEICRSGTDTLMSELQTQGRVYSFTPNERLMHLLQEQAEKHSAQCLEEQLQDAYNATTNSEAVKTLPDGIRKYYEGGIRYLEPFLAVLPELQNKTMALGILRPCLEWYVEWCDDLYKGKMCEKLIDTTHSAFAVAEKFSALCTQSKDQIKPEHRAISSYRAFQALTQKISDAEPLLKEALEWNPFNTSAKYWLHEVQQWQEIAKRVQHRIQDYSSKDLQELFHRHPTLLRNADERPFVYLVLNQIPPRDYQKPRAWGTVPDNKSVPVRQPAQPKNVRQPSLEPTPLGQPPKALGSGSTQLTRLIEKSDKALTEQHYDEAADYLTEALRHTSNEEERQDVKKRLTITYILKGEKMLPEMLKRKQDGKPYFALLRDARTAFELALQYDVSNQVAKERLAQLKV